MVVAATAETGAQLAALAQTAAKGLGILKFDVGGSLADESDARVERGVPKQVSAANSAAVTVRVWGDRGTVGVTSTTDLTPTGLTQALVMARDVSAFGNAERVPDFSPLAQATMPPVPDQTGDPVPVGQLVETLLQAEKELLAAHPAIAGVPYNGLSQGRRTRFYFNSEGAHRTEETFSNSIYLYSRTEEADKRPRSAGAYRVARDFANLDVAGCIREAAEKTIAHLNYTKVPSGKYLVAFSPEAFLSLLYAFANIFNAQSVLDKLSLSNEDSLGKALAPAFFTLMDNELHPGNPTISGFDGEGTPTQSLPLIENGVLTHFLHSSVTAKHFQAAPTGHGRLGAKVGVSPNFFCVTPGPEPAFELTTVENAIYIDELNALHAGVQASQGSFSLPLDGWWYRHGERVSIEAATVAGDMLTLLQSLVAVGTTVKVTPRGVSPVVWVDDLAITAE
ncbi:MAG TPA: peptidase C69 [Cyanobacteria bacterium UBA8156]|nr:peptidase C69 [Cyanobacteria bacterium UBA8156]